MTTYRPANPANALIASDGTLMPMGAVADGKFLKLVSGAIVGADAGGGASVFTDDAILAEIAGLAGLTSDVGRFFHDFDGRNFDQASTLGPFRVGVSGGANAPTRVVGSKGGVVIEDTSATAGGQSQLFTEMPLVGNMSTDRWGFAVKVKAIDTPTANTRSTWGFWDTNFTASVLVGAIGPLDSAHWIVQYNGNFSGSSINLGNFDVNVEHVMKVWHPGDGKVHAKLDNGTEQIAASSMSGMSVDGRLWGEMYNYGTANRFRRHTDWVAAVYPRS